MENFKIRSSICVPPHYRWGRRWKKSSVPDLPTRYAMPHTLYGDVACFTGANSDDRLQIPHRDDADSSLARVRRFPNRVCDRCRHLVGADDHHHRLAMIVNVVFCDDKGAAGAATSPLPTRIKQGKTGEVFELMQGMDDFMDHMRMNDRFDLFHR